MLISLDQVSDKKEIAVKGKSERTPPHTSGEEEANNSKTRSFVKWILMNVKYRL